MPEAIIWVVSAIGAEAASAALIIYAVEIGTAIYYTALVATAYSYQARQKRKMRDQYNAAQVDRLTNVVTTTGPRELVLGKVRKGGYILFRDSCGTYNDRFVMVVALAAHEIEGVESWYLNDQKVTLDVNGYVNEEPYNLTRTETVTVSGSVTPTDAIPGTVVVAQQVYMASDYDTPTYSTYTTYQRYTTTNSKARIRLYSGTSTQTADARLMELFPTVWTSNHRLRGIAYAIVEFVYDETAFPSGLPNLTAVVKGAKVYDPRSGLTAWSENPALHMLHVLQHPYFGKRTSVASTELARVSAAANACDELYTPSGGTAVALYRSAIVLPYGGQASDAFDDLSAAMCGSWAYAGGEFFVKAGKYTAPVIELTEDDLLTSQKDLSGSSTSKSVTINTHRSRADKVNTINVKIYDADADYKETPVAPVKNATAIAKDGRELATDLTLPSVSSASQAKVIANYMLKDSFDSLSITASFKLKAYQIELFDNIYLTLPRYGWTSKVFTVNGKKFDSTGVVELSLRETSAELFNPLVASNSSGFASNTQLVSPWEISPPTTFTVASGTSELVLQSDGTVVTRVKVSWPSITDIRLRSGGVVEVQFQELGATSWNSVVVSALETSAYLLGCRDLSVIVVRIRVTTALAISDWAKQVVHTVSGKTEPPSSVTVASVAVEDQNLVARWNPIPDVDVGGYEIRTADSDWGSAGFVFQGAGVSTLIPNYATASVWYIRAYDRSGNYSLTSKSMSFTGYTPAVKTTEVIVYQWSASAPTVSGSSTYIWENDSVYQPPANWSTTVSDTGTAGQTLWKASVSLKDSATNTTTSVNWTSASVVPFGYVGTTGAVSRVAYAKSTTVLGSIPFTYTVSGDTLPANNSWNSNTARVATTANLASLSGLLTVDSITLVAGDRVLVKNQSSTALNGLYIAASGTWTRAPEASTWVELAALKVYVTNGTANSATWWISDTTPIGILETTAITFTQRRSVSVNCATTISLAALSGLLTVDGITLVAGNRVLVKDQASSQANGVYVVASGAWTRATDADTWNELVNLNVNVSSGTVNAGTAWLSSIASGGTLNTTPVTFTPNFTTWFYSIPTLVSGESVWQTDGVYNPTANQTVWEAPYLASLKVGNLSAISTNTGNLNVSGNIKIGANGNISGGQTAYNTGIGFFLGYSEAKYRFSIGNPSGSNLLWDGSNLSISGNAIFYTPGAATSAFVELGRDFNGSVFKVTRLNTGAILLPPAYIVDYNTSTSVDAFWISANGSAGAMRVSSSSGTSENLSVFQVSGPTQKAINANGAIQALATIRSTDTTVPSSGAGAELAYFNGESYLLSYDRTNNVAKPLILFSSSTTLGGVSAIPATSTSTGSQGQIAWDSSYLYLCVASNTWKRVSLSSF